MTPQDDDTRRDNGIIPDPIADEEATNSDGDDDASPPSVEEEDFSIRQLFNEEG